MPLLFAYGINRVSHDVAKSKAKLKDNRKIFQMQLLLTAYFNLEARVM